MKFYDIDTALHEAIIAADKPVRLKIEIDSGKGFFHGVFEQDIIEAHFWGLKEVAGGTTARGEILLENQHKAYSFSDIGYGTQVKVSFSVGDDLPHFQRFTLFIDEKGIQDIRGSGRKRYVQLNLWDLSAQLKKTDEARDWTAPAIFTYSVVSDKNQPEKSLVHGIAYRAGLTADDIDCSTIPVMLPYVRLRKNVWSELSSLATAYRCHLECTPNKRLVFAHSPYQEEIFVNDDISYTFTGEDIFYLRKMARADLYRNSIRLKVNMPVSLERQEIWQYDDPPVLYDDFLQAHYPFKYPLVREIEHLGYEAPYHVRDDTGKEQDVIFADEIDTQAEAENRLDYDGGSFSYSVYDVETYHDKAIVTLTKESDGDLYVASIHGRPIVLDLNRSCFLRDSEEVQRHGTVALNVTGQYFSEYEISGESGTLPHYEDWVERELAERIQNRREFTVKTHRALVHARVGASVKIATKNEQLAGIINAFSFRYKREKSFIATFRITEVLNEGE